MIIALPLLALLAIVTIAIRSPVEAVPVRIVGLIAAYVAALFVLGWAT